MAGIARRLSMCTPIDSPTRKAISIIQRCECFSSATLSHLRMAQKVMAVKNDDMAYTSPSPAENQNESEKVKAREPTSPLPSMAYMLASDISRSRGTSFRPSMVMVQKRNNIVKLLLSADMTLTIMATLAVSPNAKREKNLPSS